MMRVFCKQMDTFKRNTELLKNYTAENKLECVEVVKINDKLIDTENISQEEIKEYADLRREVVRRYPQHFLDTKVRTAFETHTSALERRSKLLEIKESVSEVVAVNEYIAYLIDIKNEPVDRLAVVVEGGMHDLHAANRELETNVKKCGWYGVKSAFRVLFVLGATYIVTKFIFWIGGLFSKT